MRTMGKFSICFVWMSVRASNSSSIVPMPPGSVGCAMDCDFCLTGKMGFGRNLTPAEIVGQASRCTTTTR